MAYSVVLFRHLLGCSEKKNAKHLLMAIVSISTEIHPQMDPQQHPQIHPQIDPQNKSRKCCHFSWLAALKFEGTFTIEAGPELQRY